ncbi:uncharacterized protein [Haliotis asinina]|uniref:uncharacterized protein n=1 Tax=Haliotis asinina TaxID=109174 RepID=UPI0035321551
MMPLTRVLAVLVSQLVVETASGQPLGQEGIWVQPCAGTTEISDRPIHRPRRSHHLTAELLLLKLKSESAASLCGELRSRITRIILPSTANVLNTYPPLTGFPDTRTSHRVERNMTKLLLWDVERLTQVGVFLEQILTEYVDYNAELRQLETKYRETKCQVHRLLEMVGQEVTPQVSRDIMPDHLRNMFEYVHRNHHSFSLLSVRLPAVAGMNDV